MPVGLIGWQPVGSLKATRRTQHECHRRVGSTAVSYLESPGFKSGPADLWGGFYVTLRHLVTGFLPLEGI